jgi:hypothetical protein
MDQTYARGRRAENDGMVGEGSMAGQHQAQNHCDSDRERGSDVGIEEANVHQSDVQL